MLTGSSVTGEYSVAEPGGGMRIVSYRADKDGFRAVIRTSGKNDHYGFQNQDDHHRHYQRQREYATQASMPELLPITEPLRSDEPQQPQRQYLLDANAYDANNEPSPVLAAPSIDAEERSKRKVRSSTRRFSLSTSQMHWWLLSSVLVKHSLIYPCDRCCLANKCVSHVWDKSFYP